MSGLELQERLGELNVTLPIIMFSAHGDIPAVVSALQQGAMDFVEKPFAPSVFLQKVRDAIARDAIERAKSIDEAEASRLRGELPDGLDLTSYAQRLTDLEAKLEATPHGKRDAYDFEEVVGDIIKLCFFRSLANVEPKVRTCDGRSIRDWVAANRGYGGFWEMVRHKWGATQIVWECKNYANLSASDFHQISYYMNDQMGRFGIVVFRGEISPKYWRHLRSILKDENALVLLLSELDLNVFIRQARSGKVEESHIQDRYDHTIREIG